MRALDPANTHFLRVRGVALPRRRVRRWRVRGQPDTLALEIDGYEFHTGREVFGTDRERRNSRQLAGWTVLHFTWKHLNERPDYVIETVRRGIRHARRLKRLRRQAGAGADLAARSVG